MEANLHKKKKIYEIVYNTRKRNILRCVVITGVHTELGFPS